MLYEVFIMSMVYALPQGESQGDFSELSRGFAGGARIIIGCGHGSVLPAIFCGGKADTFFWQFLDCRDKVFSDFISTL